MFVCDEKRRNYTAMPSSHIKFDSQPYNANMKRRLTIAIILGAILVLSWPELEEEKELSFPAYATIQAKPKLSIQDERAKYLQALRFASKEPLMALNQLDEIALSASEFSLPARSLAHAIRSAELSENTAYIYTSLGQSFAQIGAWDLSVIALENAIENDANYAEAWAYLGEAQQHTGKDGLAALRMALELDPLSISANLFQALYSQRKGEYEDALRFLQIAHLMDPENASIALQIGRVLVLSGDILQAKDYFERAVAIDPDNIALWKELAAYSLDNDVFLEELAFPAARGALVLQANDPEALVLMARATYQLNNLANEAINLLNRALEISPEYAQAHLQLAIILLAIGESQDAESHFRLAEAFAQNAADATFARAILDEFFP